MKTSTFLIGLLLALTIALGVNLFQVESRLYSIAAYGCIIPAPHPSNPNLDP